MPQFMNGLWMLELMCLLAKCEVSQKPASFLRLTGTVIVIVPCLMENLPSSFSVLLPLPFCKHTLACMHATVFLKIAYVIS